MAKKDQVSSRQEIFNAIEESRAAQVNAELEELGSDDRIEHDPTPELKRAAGKDVDDDVVDETTEAGDTEADTGESLEDAPSKAAKDEPTETIYDFLGEEKLDTTKVKIKVDGVEQEIAVADLVRGHQKATAADKRLEDAAFANRLAQQTLIEAREEAARIRAQNSDTGNAGDEQQASLSGKDAITSAMSLIYEGNQEEAAGILDAEINRRVAEKSGATVDTAQLAAQIKTDLSWDAALGAFNRDHADIAADPELARMFQRHLNEAAQSSTTPQQAIDRATETVTGWLSKVSGKSDDDGEQRGLRVDAGALKQRQADKAKSDSVRSTTSIRSQSRAEPEEEYNPSKVVEEMKRARGQL